MNGFIEFCESFDYFSIYRVGLVYLLFRYNVLYSVHNSCDSALSEAIDWCADDFYFSLISYMP